MSRQRAGDLEAWLRTVNDSGTGIRELIDACQGLGARREQRAVQPLTHLLGHSDDRVALTAADALASIGGDAALEALERTPAADHPQAPLGSISEGLGAAAARLRATLRGSARRADEERLVALVQRDEASVARRAAAALRGGGPEVAEALQRAYAAGPPAGARYRLVDALGSLDPRPRAALLQALADEAPGVRVAALLGLRYGDAALVPHVLPLLEDPEPQVRLQAVLCLSFLREPTAEALAALERAAATDTGEVLSGRRRIRVAATAQTCAASLRRKLAQG